MHAFGFYNGCSRRAFGRHFGPFGAAFAHGRGLGGRSFFTGRKLGSDELQVVILALLAERPRHGYEIIKALEELSNGFYAPSPGMVYPALTYLEEVGYATVEAEGSKKLYRITEAGLAKLDEHRSYADALMAQLAQVGKKMERVRQARMESYAEQIRTLPKGTDRDRAQQAYDDWDTMSYDHLLGLAGIQALGSEAVERIRRAAEKGVRQVDGHGGPQGPGQHR